MPPPPVPPEPAENTLDPAMSSPTDPATVPNRRNARPVPELPVLPGYEIEGLLARGGMGCVYAGREVALDREVAIKTLLPGASGERFLTEARITARLPHPCIPPVYALGLGLDGRPYLVMKRIRGETLDALLEARAAPREDLSRFLSVFEQICQAVGFAHAQGVVHRDLKPLNVMVGAFGEVQVMDWGLAKVLGTSGVASEVPASRPSVDWREQETLAEPLGAPVHDSRSREDTPAESSHTQAGTVLGTLGYMSPEQARGAPVDARTDVFALGSLLCVLLTGRPAYLGGEDILERMARGDLGEAFASLDRSGADTRLIGLAKRCLAPNPDGRPANARELAREIADHRAMVETRLRKAETEAAGALLRHTEQQKRHRLRQVATSLVALTLLLGVLGTSLALWRANDLATRESEARIEAEDKRILADRARDDETRAKELAQRERDAKERQRRYADAIAHFLLYDFLALTTIEGQARFAGDDRSFLSKETTLTELLDRAAGKLENRTDLEPRTRASLTRMVGISYHSMGQLKRAIPFLERAYRLLGEQDAPLAEQMESANSLATAYRSARRIEEAIALWERFLADPRTAEGGEAEDLALVMKSNLAGAYRVSGRHPEALRLFEEVFRQLGARPSAPVRLSLSTMSNLGATYLALKRVGPAVRMHRQGMELAQKLLGENDPFTLSFSPALAEALQAGNGADEALALLERTLPRCSERLGDSHPITLQHLERLANLYRARRQPDRAIALLERGRTALGQAPENAEQRATQLNNLGLLYSESKRHGEAIAALREAVALTLESGQPTPEPLFTYRDNLGFAHLTAGRAENAIEILTALRHDRIQLHGPQHPGLVLTLGNLTASYRRAGQLRRAAETAFEAYSLRKKLFGPENRETIAYLAICDALMRDSRDGDRLVALTPELVARYRVLFAGNPAELAGRLTALGYDLLRCDRGVQAEALLRESLAYRKKNQPDDWRTFSTESMLGEALLLQKKTAQAEPLLLGGWEGMVRRRARIPAAAAADRLTEGADRLVSLYRAVGKAEEAERWRAEWLRWGRILPMPQEVR